MSGIIAGALRMMGATKDDTIRTCPLCNVMLVTVRHSFIGTSACDACAAKISVDAAKAYVNVFKNDPSDPLLDVYATLLKESNWIDVEGSMGLRQVNEKLSSESSPKEGTN